jgi:hypothetical protein
MNTLLPPTDADVTRMRERLFKALPAATQQRKRRKVSFAVALSAGVLVLGATTAGAIAQSLASVDAQNTSFDCYTTTDVSGPHGTTAFVDTGRDKTTLNSLADRVKLAVATCEAGYRAVPTGPGEDGTTAPRTGPVPNPTACLLGDGRIAVLPNREALTTRAFCGSLGLHTPGS